MKQEELREYCYELKRCINTQYFVEGRYKHTELWETITTNIILRECDAVSELTRICSEDGISKRYDLLRIRSRTTEREENTFHLVVL